MEEFQTNYQAMEDAEDEHDAPPGDNIVHVISDNGRARWNHIEDLDEFFTRVYQYHQRNGFLCMAIQDLLQLVQFMFVVLFTAFLIDCVNYDALFGEIHYNETHKVKFDEVIYPIHQCVSGFSPALVICLCVASFFWFFRFIKIIYNMLKYLEMRAFYTQALKISANDLCNMTWHEVQRRLLEVQREQQMCIHKQELTELDIYHRILRFKNYMVAMVNKSLIPLRYKVPFYGDYIFLTTGLKYNLEMILFWGPWSPFKNNWHLKADYKNHHKRKDLAAYLSRRILWIGIGNLVLSPLIFLWQILYSFFRYAEILKRDPNTLGSRMWSLNSRLYLRHFNELDHEFNARLNRGYKPAERYMNIFTSPILVILAKYVAFFSGAILAVLVILTVIDEDVLAVQHMIATMTILGVVTTVCRACIPDEHLVWCPELLMRQILAQIHYIPDNWKGQAHTTRVRDEFGQLFQYKLVYLLEELFSPLVTPFILCIKLRSRALDIVDFYRNFSVEVTGVGEVCSFAQMDIRRHGNAQWEQVTDANQSQQAEDGKTELSLMHFTLTNPEWRPPVVEGRFISQLKEQAHRDAGALSMLPADNPLVSSLHSLTSGGGYFGFHSMISSLVGAHQGQRTSMFPEPSLQPSGMDGELGGPPSLAPLPLSPLECSAAPQSSHPARPHKMTSLTCRGGIRNSEGPLGGSTNGILASLQGGTGLAGSGGEAMSHPHTPTDLRTPRIIDEEQLELLSAEMSFSALYLHELHRRRMFQPLMDVVTTPQDPAPPSGPSSLVGPSVLPTGPTPSLPHINEHDEEEDEHEENNEASPLLFVTPKSSFKHS